MGIPPMHELTTEVVFTTDGSLKEIFTAFSKAQSEFKAVEKSKDGHYGKYADLADINNATRPALAKNNLCVFQGIDKTSGTVKTVIGHSSGQHIVFVLKYNHPQSLKATQDGAVFTLMRRYALQSALQIAGDDDAESINSGVTFTPNDGLSSDSQEILDKAIVIEDVKALNKYIGSVQLSLKRLEKTDKDDYDYLDKKLKMHKDFLTENAK